MSEPIVTDIGINPVRSDRRLFAGCVANATGIKYGMVVVGDTSSTNFRDVKLPAAAGATGVRGVVSDHGDPNASQAFALGDEFAVCTEGYVEVLLDAGATATKDAPAICSGTTPGAVKQIASESAPYDIVGTFAQTYDNSAGSNPVLVSMKLGVYRRFS